MGHFPYELAVLFEHPEWQKPLFSALERRGIRFLPVDLKAAAFGDQDPVLAPLFFNQASPSAYVRGNTRAVPFALSYMRTLARRGVRVLNGADVFALELSKSAQAALLRSLGLDTPRTIAFNDVEALRARGTDLPFPALIKPDQGGSGARIYRADSVDEIARLLESQPNLWEPEQLLNLQEFCPYDTDRGIVRMEFLGGRLLYAMRVVTHGRFNLCPAPVCNPEEGEGESSCEVVPSAAAPPVEFYPYPEVPDAAVQAGLKIIEAANIDVGGIEYLDSLDGRRVFYDINANSNLRPSIAQAFGFDPFERVVTFLAEQIAKQLGSAS